MPTLAPVEPLRVAFDVGPLAGVRTGVGHAVGALAAALRDRDDVTLHEYVVSWRAPRRPGGPVRLALPAMFAHRLWAHLDRPCADRWLDGVDVIHGTNYVVPPAHVPRVVSVYDCWFLRHPDLASGDVRRAGRVLRRSVAGGALIHASSQATADSARELLPGADVTVVPLGALTVPHPAPESPVPGLAGRRYVLAIGTIERRKNLPRLVEAFARIAGEPDAGDVLLVIAGGDGDDRAALDEAIDRVGPAVARRIVLAGRVDEGARGWLLRHATALAYPSLDEGFGFPLLDAMQVGVPIVAADAGSIPEVAGDAALLVPATDVDALAAALRTAVADDTTRARLIAAGAARWTQYTWPACAAAMEHLYRRAADSSGPPRRATTAPPKTAAVRP